MKFLDDSVCKERGIQIPVFQTNLVFEYLTISATNSGLNGKLRPLGVKFVKLGVNQPIKLSFATLSREWHSVPKAGRDGKWLRR